MTVQEIPILYPGDAVKLRAPHDKKFPGVLQVQKLNPKKVKLLTADGGTVTADYSLVVKTEDEFTLNAPAQVFHLGDTVQFTDSALVKPQHKGHLYVIINHGSVPGTYKVARLNGGDDRYFTNMHSSSFVKAEPIPGITT